MKFKNPQIISRGWWHVKYQGSIPESSRSKSIWVSNWGCRGGGSPFCCSYGYEKPLSMSTTMGSELMAQEIMWLCAEKLSAPNPTIIFKVTYVAAVHSHEDAQRTSLHWVIIPCYEIKNSDLLQSYTHKSGQTIFLPRWCICFCTTMFAPASVLALQECFQ